MTADEFRLEVKAIVDATQIDSFIARIKSHSFIFEKAYPDRWVNNIYFDTINYASFVENIEGGKSRTKLRLRWYGDLSRVSQAQLEVKRKENGQGTKKIFSLNDSSQFELKNIGQDELIREINNAVPDEGGMYLRLFPNTVLVNRYHRMYFEDLTKKLRVTIDRNLEFYPQLFSKNLSLMNKSQKQSVAVIEFKYSAENHKLANELMDSLRLRTSRFSKYVVGTQSGLNIL